MIDAAQTSPDPVLAGAADLARAAALDLAGAADVGAHLGVEGEGELVATHLFACTRLGYLGWRWSVTLSRAADSDVPTVNEAVLLPGEEAIVAPSWVPYKERLQPGDLSPGDLLPVEDEDPRLVPTYSFGDDPLDSDAKAQVRQVAQDLGLGRVRTLSTEGTDMAAERWYDGDGGPESPLAKNAPESCWSCGFLVRISGHLADTFGVCANGNANDDGRVVSFDHGCGAHSEVKLARKQQPIPVPDHAFDTLTDDEFVSL
ncbi:DUF3027 domain-containing protein [Nocardioides sp.]|uniref:DUF3027 domain-containing protein n=1 Tax=Nocardioides sp. TaxID=35761 RepID=UPI002C40004A|nr:DUF3027 domain-containing protein [Nocardioides sp.]HXH78905.1 DUF3027 domain-containing protein [Nocardioides sp.]